MRWGLMVLLAVIGAVSGAVIAACRPVEPEPIIQTVIVEKKGDVILEQIIITVEPTPEPEIEVEACCEIYRIGIYEEPVSLNYWNYLGPGSSVWTRYVVSGDAASLFELSDRNFQFVPSLARNIPGPVENPEDGAWQITVEMVEDALWSDGEPITAHDVVFTHNACKDLRLGWYWPLFCVPDGASVEVEALDDFTVQYTYLDQRPTLKNWQFGAALAPILPEHFWAETIAEAHAIIEEVAVPLDPRPGNCESTALGEAEKALCEAWAGFDEAFDRAQQIVYQAGVADQPVAGGYVVAEWEPGEYIRLVPNEHYYFQGAEIVEFADGSWQLTLPNGTQHLLYGAGEGEETIRYTLGPYNPGVLFSIYGSQEAAFGALLAGEVDYVLNPISLPPEIREEIGGNPGIETYANSDYNMFYLAFNMRRYPMSEYAFRQAFDIIIDKELVINQLLGGTVIPLYTTMPPNNTFWYNPEVPIPYRGLGRAERVALAVQVLKDAGWRWASEPYWDENIQVVVPGEGLVMPNGQPMPELAILGPGPDFDIVRATFNQWVSEWARELGMPVRSELTGRNTILDSVFVASDYDMYIFGLPLGNPAYPGYFEEFWYSQNCTFETGGKNTSCFEDDAYDALVDEFAATSDLQKAQELVFQMQLILASERPYIPLYSEKIYDFARREVVFPYSDTLGGIELQDGFLTSTKVLKSE